MAVALQFGNAFIHGPHVLILPESGKIQISPYSIVAANRGYNDYSNQGVLDAFFMEWEERSQNPEALFFGSPVMEAIGRRV